MRQQSAADNDDAASDSSSLCSESSHRSDGIVSDVCHFHWMSHKVFFHFINISAEFFMFVGIHSSHLTFLSSF